MTDASKSPLWFSRASLAEFLRLVPPILAALSAYAVVLAVVFTLAELLARERINAFGYFTLADLIDRSITAAIACCLFLLPLASLLPLATLKGAHSKISDKERKRDGLIFIGLFTAISAASFVAAYFAPPADRPENILTGVISAFFIPTSITAWKIPAKWFWRAVAYGFLLIIPLQITLTIGMVRGRNAMACPRVAIVHMTTGHDVQGEVVARLSRGILLVRGATYALIPWDHVELLTDRPCPSPPKS